MDVSGSMYYFNGMDGRLDRLLETATLVMEALEGFENKIEYAVSGHSGDSAFIPFVDYGRPPRNRKERFIVLQKMAAHTQYTMSGDSTLEGTRYAIEEVAKADADEHFVFVISDANLQRYGISPVEFGRMLTSDPKVKAYAIFIASLGNQVQRLIDGLPAGHGFVCLSTSDLPSTFKNVLKSNVLK